MERKEDASEERQRSGKTSVWGGRVLFRRCKRIRCRVSLSCSLRYYGLLQHGSAACSGSEGFSTWGLQNRSGEETRGQKLWQRMAEVKMEGFRSDLLDLKISEVEYSKSWASRGGWPCLCPMFLPLPKVEDMLISLVRFQDIN